MHRASLVMLVLGGMCGLIRQATSADTQPLFQAVGIHDCLSQTTGARQCAVTGSDYQSCGQAQEQLRMVDCCGLRPAGGHSVSFALQSCVATSARKQQGQLR